MNTLHEQPLMPIDLLRRRMTRLVRKGRKGGAFRPSVTLGDIARWFAVDYKLLMHMECGTVKINDKWQVQLSQFFTLLDAGLIALKVVGRHKTWERVTPTEPPCKAPMPRIDFAATKLRWD